MERKIKSGLLRVLIREIRWILREPSFIIIMFVLPVVMFFIFTSMFSNGVPRDIPVAVLDCDNSVLSREVIRRLDSIPSLKVSGSINTLYEGRAALHRGDVYAVIYIPADFEKNAEHGTPVRIINYYNNENQLLGGTIVRDITAGISSISTEKFKDNLSRKGMPRVQVDAMAEPIRASVRVLFNPYTNYMYYLVSGLLPTALHFFVILSSIYSIGIEIKKGSIDEAIETGGGNIAAVITGKLLPYTFIYTAIGMFMLILMFGYLHFPMQGDMFIIIAATVLLVLCYQAAGLFFIGVSGSLINGLLSSSFYASSAFTFTGMTFPMISMFYPARIWSYFLPLTHYLNIIVEQAFRGSPVNISAKSFFYMILFLFLPFIIYPRLKDIMTDRSRREEEF